MKLYFYVAINVIFVHSKADGFYIMETASVAFRIGYREQWSLRQNPQQYMILW